MSFSGYWFHQLVYKSVIIIRDLGNLGFLQSSAWIFPFLSFESKFIVTEFPGDQAYPYV